jgi:four helix bundle protein
MFASALADCDGEAPETPVWIDFAYECEYISRGDHDQLSAGYETVGEMINGMITHPGKFT